MRRAVVPIGSILAAVLVLLSRPAWAGPLLDRASLALRRDPVFVDPSAQRSISAADASRIRERINRSGQPVFFAVLPQQVVAEVGGDPAALPGALRREVGLSGTYAVVAGNSFRAASDVLPRGQAGSLATAVMNQHRSEGTAPVLLAFVDQVTSAGANRSVTESPSQPDGRGGSNGSGSGLGVFALAALAGGTGLVLWRRRKRNEELVASRESLRPYLQVLADDTLALEPEVALHPEARDDYEAGVSRYRLGEAALDKVRTNADVEQVRRVLLEGQYAMDRARARVQGREPPPPPPELTVAGPNAEPPVVIDDGGGPAYAGFGGGWYGGGGWFNGSQLLAGLLIGQALGGLGAWGSRPGWAGHGWGYPPDAGAEASQGGDWADSGGGDWGDPGGDPGSDDFGGGDWGGGDFGGGDSGAGGGDW